MTGDTEDSDIATEPTGSGLLDLRSLADLRSTAVLELIAVSAHRRAQP